jgi:hypothetical protein
LESFVDRADTHGVFADRGQAGLINLELAVTRRG